MAGKRRERVGLGKACEVAPVELRAMREIGAAREGRDTPRVDDPLRTGFRQSGDQAKTESQRGIRASIRLHFFQRAVPLAHRHVHRAAPRRHAGARRRTSCAGA